MEYSILIIGLIAIYILITFRVLIDFENFSFLNPIENYEEWEALKQKVFFHEYLLRYLGRYGQEKQDSPLWYQTEYVIVGKDNDTDNLKGIVNRIFVIREAANTMYLTGSEE